MPSEKQGSLLTIVPISNYQGLRWLSIGILDPGWENSAFPWRFDGLFWSFTVQWLRVDPPDHPVSCERGRGAPMAKGDFRSFSHK